MAPMQSLFSTSHRSDGAETFLNPIEERVAWRKKGIFSLGSGPINLLRRHGLM